MVNIDPKFKLLFWFCFYLFNVSFFSMMALLYIPVPESNEGMANNTQGFLQGSLIMSAVGFLLTGNISALNNKKPTPEGTTTANISAEIITDNTNNESS